MAEKIALDERPYHNEKDCPLIKPFFLPYAPQEDQEEKAYCRNGGNFHPGRDAEHGFREPSLLAIYGKRVIIIGGGAQVGQVAVGAISEADRHNIRGERISVDTIPLVGEQALAAAVRAVARLPRAQILVLAGSIMGGEITEAVGDLRKQGIKVIALNMVGSVRDAADLVVTDPLQAGVMAVMAIASTARFDITRQQGRVY